MHVAGLEKRFLEHINELIRKGGGKPDQDHLKVFGIVKLLCIFYS